MEVLKYPRENSWLSKETRAERRAEEWEGDGGVHAHR